MAGRGEAVGEFGQNPCGGNDRVVVRGRIGECPVVGGVVRIEDREVVESVGEHVAHSFGAPCR